jgi:hypothetical protein
MKLQFLLVGAAALALAAGASHAATKKSAGNYAEPSQPIAYSKLDSYLKSSAHSRKAKDWTLGSQTAAAAAAPGSAANASATAPTGAMQPSGGVTNDQQGASAPAPAASAPNPPATQDQPPAPQAAPDTSAQPPAAPAGSAPQ